MIFRKNLKRLMDMDGKKVLDLNDITMTLRTSHDTSRHVTSPDSPEIHVILLCTFEHKGQGMEVEKKLQGKRCRFHSYRCTPRLRYSTRVNSTIPLECAPFWLFTTLSRQGRPMLRDSKYERQPVALDPEKKNWTKGPWICAISLRRQHDWRRNKS